MLLYIVYALCLTTFIDHGLAQSSNQFNAYNPRSAPPPRPSYPGGQPASFDDGLRPAPPQPNPVRSAANELRTAANLVYPQPDNVTDSLVAQIHGSGVFGYASFHPIRSTNGGFHVKIHIAGPSKGESFFTRIYEYPVQNGATCSSASLGSLLYELTPPSGAVEINREVSLTVPTLKVNGPTSIIGRTLMLQSAKDGSTICAVIMPGDRSKLILQGKLHAPIAGMVYYIQSSEGAVLGTEWMMFSDGRRRYDSFSWKLIKAAPEDTSVDRKINHEKTLCNQLNGQIIYSSTETLLPVSTESPIWRGRMHTGLDPVVTREDTIYLVVTSLDNNKNVACTSLNPIIAKTGRANFDRNTNNGVEGQIIFTQDSPFEPTRVTIDLKLPTPAFSYGIDVLPSLRRRNKEIKSCPNVKETIYNPFHVDPDRVPQQGQGTTDMYAVGDLSGKYGTLESKPNVFLKTWDSNLPLFGYYSVIGRAIVIYGPQGPAVTCTNIDLNGRPLTTAYATFDYPVQGQFIFRQPEGECFSDTYLYIEVSRHPGSGPEKTVNHNWHVHDNPISLTDNALSTNDCNQAGAHLNPFNVSIPSKNPIYIRDCNIFTPTRCEVGDLAHKLGPIDIPPYKASQDGKEPEVAKYYWIDSDLPLCGPSKIVQRSLVIHQSDFQMPKLSCANLLVYVPKQ